MEFACPTAKSTDTERIEHDHGTGQRPNLL